MRKVINLEVDLVVLCNALTPKCDAKKLAETLDIEQDEYGFFKSLDPLYAPVDTNVPGIYVCGCCQGPKDIPDSVAQASGATARAVEVAIKGKRNY